jgi:hypothetical protein
MDISNRRGSVVVMTRGFNRGCLKACVPTSQRKLAHRNICAILGTNNAGVEVCVLAL